MAPASINRGDIRYPPRNAARRHRERGIAGPNPKSQHPPIWPPRTHSACHVCSVARGGEGDKHSQTARCRHCFRAFTPSSQLGITKRCRFLTLVKTRHSSTVIDQVAHELPSKGPDTSSSSPATCVPSSAEPCGRRTPSEASWWRRSNETF